MIAIARPTPEEPDEPQGGQGEIVSQPLRSNATLIRRAIREDWPISAEVRKAVVTQMAVTAISGANERDRIAAAKTLVAADAVNAKREAMDQADEHKRLPNLHLHQHNHAAAMTDDDLQAIILDQPPAGCGDGAIGPAPSTDEPA